MDWSKSGYLALSALNVKDGYIDYSADAHYANQKLYDKWMSGNNLVKGQVLFTTEAPMGNVAQVPDNKGYVLSQRTIAFVTNKDKITDDFLASILRTPQSFKRLSALSSGGTAKGVSQKSLSSFKLVIPPSLKEQEKIGKLFRSFEHTIYLHEEKRKQLEQLKKALLQKMFADKTNFPEIRFNGYVGPWEQVKFGKITSKYKTRNKDGEQLRSFSVSNIYGFIPQEEQFENGGIALNADKKNSIIVTPNSFAYNPARINVGSIGYYNGNENVLVSSLYEVFKLHKEYDPNYLWFWLKSNHFNWWIHRLQEGSVRSYFYYDKFSEIKERMPSLPEQMKIGQLLKSLDHTITLHDQKIEDLKQLKQALLQQMFI